MHFEIRRRFYLISVSGIFLCVVFATNYSNREGSGKILMAKLLRSGLIVFLLFTGLSFPGCRLKKPPEKLQVKMMAMDFEVTDDIATVPKERKGWWFGSRDIYRNPNAGEIFSDIFVKRFDNKIPHVLVYSRMDLKYYMANKKSRLKKAYPALDEGAIDHLITVVPVMDFARDLQQDKVLIGKIKHCYTSHNRAFHWWSSVVDLDAVLMDAESGKPVWSGSISLRKKFHSQYSTMEVAADRLINKMKKEYFDK